MKVLGTRVGVGGGKTDSLTGEGHSIIEQTQYTDIWANDNYLQFMFERLILMRELLSDAGSIYLHCDPTMSHYLKLLMDEIFGTNQFRNEIVWLYRKWTNAVGYFQRNHDVILFYSKSDSYLFNKLFNPHAPQATKYERGWDTNRVAGVKQLIVYNKEKAKNEMSSEKYDRIVYRLNPEGTAFADWWELNYLSSSSSERVDYPTQKPEVLIERIIKASSNEDSIVLDCFVGSGTTAVVAEKLRRRWIAADLNRGAIQTTMKRIQTTIAEHRGIAHYRINNYHFSEQQELRRLLIEKYGVETDKKDPFFDGTVDGTLVKIVELTKPLTRLDIQLIKDELQHRPDETRSVTVLCNGSELGIQAELDAENKHHPINKLIVRDIQRDGVTTFAPAEAEVAFKRDEQHVTITLVDYISPSLLGRLDIARTLFDEQVDDFRSQIDCVLIDTDYNGRHFRIVESDVPEKQSDFIMGQYTVVLPRRDARVAVKIIDMLGEETVVTE